MSSPTAVNRTLFHLSGKAVGAISTQFTKKATILVVEEVVIEVTKGNNNNNINKTTVKIQRVTTEEQQGVNKTTTHHRKEHQKSIKLIYFKQYLSDIERLLVLKKVTINNKDNKPTG